MPRVVDKSLVDAAVAAVNNCNGSRIEAANLLGIKYQTLIDRIKNRSDVIPASRGRKRRRISAPTPAPVVVSSAPAPTQSDNHISRSSIDRIRKNVANIDIERFFSVCNDVRERSLWIDYWSSPDNLSRNCLVEFYYGWCLNFSNNFFI